MPRRIVAGIIALGVGCITSLELVALHNGIDGIGLAAAISGITAIISAFTGYKIGKRG